MAGIIKTNASIRGGVSQSSSRHTAMSTCFDIYLGTTQIGFVSQITLGHSRTVTQIRHLNSMDAGVAVDSVVTPDVVTLNFNGFYIYAADDAKTKTLNSQQGVKTSPDSNLGVGPSVGRLSGIPLMMTLDQQGTIFDIVVKHAIVASPFTVAGTETIIGVYRNCIVQSMSIPINIGTAAVADSGVISVGFVANSQ